MGLDMWLYEKEQEKAEAQAIGYWRKANQIRKFFASYAPEQSDINIEMLIVNDEMLLELKQRIMLCLTERNEKTSSELLYYQPVKDFSLVVRNMMIGIIST